MNTKLIIATKDTVKRENYIRISSLINWFCSINKYIF